MSTDFWISAYNFVTYSNHLLNGGMEVDSNFSTLGDNTSSFITTSPVFAGAYSRGFYTSASSPETFNVFTNSLYVGSEYTGLPFCSRFCLTEDDDLVYYSYPNKRIYHCDGISTNVKSSFLYPNCFGLQIGAMACYSGNLIIACNTQYINTFGLSSRIMVMNGISGDVSEVHSYQWSAIVAMAFDDDGNMITAHEGWYDSGGYTWSTALTKRPFGQFSYDAKISNITINSGKIIGLNKSTSANRLYCFLNNKTIVEITNISTVALSVLSYSDVFTENYNYQDGDSFGGFALTSQFSTTLISKVGVLNQSSENCAVVYGFPCWSTTLDYQLKYSYLRHSGCPIFANSGQHTITAAFRRRCGNNYKINLRRSDGNGYHYQSAALDKTNNEWNEYIFTFSPTVSDSNAIFELVHYGQSSAQSYIDGCRVGLKENYNSLGTIQVYPDWDYKRQIVTSKAENRTYTGKLYQYKWGHYSRFDLTLKYVANSKADAMNSWWAQDAVCYFKIYSGGDWETNTVHIVNANVPFLDYSKPYDIYKDGTLQLETY